MGLNGSLDVGHTRVLLGRDYTTVGRDGEFAAGDGVKSALPDNRQNEESASNGRKLTEKNRSPAHNVPQYPVG